ncbi:MAG: hypothetical protein ACRCY8_10745 [Dermatophilaceae bacterium]
MRSVDIRHDRHVTDVRDYLAWHDMYDDPNSSLSRRLELIREVLRTELSARPGPVRVLSLCAGDGRDILGVLKGRDDASRVTVALVEVLPQLVERARAAAADTEATVEVVAADAGFSTTYANLRAVPADVVLLVGVLGNLNEPDVSATVNAMPQLCAPGATLIWSRGRSLHGADDFIAPVRRLFAAAGFSERETLPFDVDEARATLGVVRYDGPPVPLLARHQWFRFAG